MGSFSDRFRLIAGLGPFDPRLNKNEMIRMISDEKRSPSEVGRFYLNQPCCRCEGKDEELDQIRVMNRRKCHELSADEEPVTSAAEIEGIIKRMCADSSVVCN